MKTEEARAAYLMWAKALNNWRQPPFFVKAWHLAALNADAASIALDLANAEDSEQRIRESVAW